MNFYQLVWYFVHANSHFFVLCKKIVIFVPEVQLNFV